MSAPAQKLFEAGVIGFDELVRGISETTVNTYRAGYDDGFAAGAEDEEFRFEEKCDEYDALYRENNDNEALVRWHRKNLCDIREIAAKLKAAVDHPEDKTADARELINELMEAVK